MRDRFFIADPGSVIVYAFNLLANSNYPPSITHEYYRRPRMKKKKCLNKNISLFKSISASLAQFLICFHCHFRVAFSASSELLTVRVIKKKKRHPRNPREPKLTSEKKFSSQSQHLAPYKNPAKCHTFNEKSTFKCLITFRKEKKETEKKYPNNNNNTNNIGMAHKKRPPLTEYRTDERASVAMTEAETIIVFSNRQRVTIKMKMFP